MHYIQTLQTFLNAHFVIWYILIKTCISKIARQWIFIEFLSGSITLSITLCHFGVSMKFKILRELHNIKKVMERSEKTLILHESIYYFSRFKDTLTLQILGFQLC